MLYNNEVDYGRKDVNDTEHDNTRDSNRKHVICIMSEKLTTVLVIGFKLFANDRNISIGKLSPEDFYYLTILLLSI